MAVQYINPSLLLDGIGHDCIVFRAIHDKGRRFFLPKEAYEYAQKISDFSGRKEIKNISHEGKYVKFYVDPPFETKEIAYEIIKYFGPGGTAKSIK